MHGDAEQHNDDFCTMPILRKMGNEVVSVPIQVQCSIRPDMMRGVCPLGCWHPKAGTAGVSLKHQAFQRQQMSRMDEVKHQLAKGLTRSNSVVTRTWKKWTRTDTHSGAGGVTDL